MKYYTYTCTIIRIYSNYSLQFATFNYLQSWGILGKLNI